jgi:transcriptional regulator with XRE-family HTH domain
MHEVDFDILRKNLKTLRNLNDLTAKELSEKAGLKQMKRVSDIEEGRGSPSLNEIYSLSKVLDRDICELLFKELKLKAE